MSLQAAGLVPYRKGGKRGDAAPSGSGGATKYIIAVAMLLTAGAATYSLMPAPSASAPSSPAPETAPEPPVSVQAARPANSLARLVEVTGVRFMEVNNKPQIHYLVVNHSNAPLHSMTVYVTLRASSAKPGQPPIAKITFRSPALAAFEAKEMFSSIERAPHRSTCRTGRTCGPTSTCSNPTQFSDGRSTWSMTRNSLGPLAGTSFNPSCSCIAEKIVGPTGSSDGPTCP